VAEGFGLSGLRGHKTGGTMHIVVNNQIGFTTAPHFSRSSPYPTDIALMVEAPIFHVQKFHKDVVLDIICYRRFGHNEGDEPMFTNPVMYKKIKTQKTTLTLYTERLVRDGLIPEGEVEDTNPTRPTGWTANGPISMRAKRASISAAKPPSPPRQCLMWASRSAKRLTTSRCTRPSGGSWAALGCQGPDV